MVFGAQLVCPLAAARDRQRGVRDEPVGDANFRQRLYPGQLQALAVPN